MARPPISTSIDPRSPATSFSGSCWDFSLKDRFLAWASQERAPWYSGSVRSALHYAAAHNHPNVVRLLSSNDCTNINMKDDESCTPLMKAAQRDNLECASILLMHGADPHVVDANGDAALHHAICRGNIKLVSKLLEYNVDIKAKTEYGLTPYKLALFENQHKMARFLIENGANAELEVTPNSERKTAKGPGKKKKKRVNFNKEVHYDTDLKPFCRDVQPAGEVKSILKKSNQISGDNGRNKDHISLGLSENPDGPASTTVDKASTSAIQEDIDNSSSRYMIIQKQILHSKKITQIKKRDRARLSQSVMDLTSVGESLPEFARKKSYLMVILINFSNILACEENDDFVFLSLYRCKSCQRRQTKP